MLKPNLTFSASESVRALYDYFSSDEASLSFKKGEIIKVLTELESGWCQGEKGNEKGWFPKNFVEKIEDMGHIPVSLEFNLDREWAGKDGSRSGEVVKNSRMQEWFQQNERNTSSIYINHDEKSDINELNKDNEFTFQRIENWQPQAQFPELKPDSEMDKYDHILPRYCPPSENDKANGEDIMSLPPNWCKKMTASKRIYYFNMITDECFWSLPSSLNKSSKKFSEARRGSLVSENSVATNLSDITFSRLIPAKFHQNLLYASSYLGETSLNWDGIISNIVCTVHKLIYTIKKHAKSKYLKNASHIVEAIRLMLLASGTAQADAPIFSSHNWLKAYHKLILLSLCDLVLIAKVASGIWPPPDMESRLEKGAIHILLLSRLFVEVAQRVMVGAKTKLLLNGNDTEFNNDRFQFRSQSQSHQILNNSRAKIGSTHLKFKEKERERRQYGVQAQHIFETRRGSSDHESTLSGENIRLSTIDTLKRFNQASRSTFIAIECLSERLMVNNDVNQQLVNLVKLVIKEVGQFITLLDQFSLEKVSDQSSAMFKAYRQTLFDNLSLLVLVTKTITENYAKNGNSSTEQILTNIQRIEKSIHDLLISIKFVLEERDLKEYNELRRKLNTFSAVLDMDSKRSDFMEITPPLRRCFSLSNLYSSPIDTNENNKSSIIQLNKSMRHAHQNSLGFMESEIHSDDELTETSEGGRKDSISKSQKNPSDKLRQILGKDAPLSNGKTHGMNKDGSISIKSSETKPWFLGHDYTNDILIFEKGKVRGGTVEGLVECLTFHDNWDPNFMATFMLTYRSFVSTRDLFRLIFRRFNLPRPPGLTSSEYEVWKTKKLMVIRLRVFNVLKSWVENYYQENEDLEALEELQIFVNTDVREALSSLANQLLNLIEKRLQGKDMEFKKMVKKSQEEPIPIYPKNYDSFLDMDPLEIARQLTLIDSQLFNRIKPVECLNKAWSKNDGGAPNVKRMIEMSTQVTNWVSLMILFEDSIRMRALYIKHFIAIAEQCSSLFNFNTLMAITASLNSSPIHRLRRTWEIVSPKSKATLDELSRIMNSERNFSVYRAHLHSINPPCVPFLGVYLTDLTFVADGNPDLIPETKLINFFKQAKTAEIIREIQQYQNSMYYLKPISKMQEFLRAKMDYSVTDAQLYDRSLILEPKEREEEKIARLLHESGFL